MSGLNPDWSDDAVRARALAKTSGLPPKARPGSAMQRRAEVFAEQISLRAQTALRCPPVDDPDLNI